jgi:anti-anti-sigma factor
MTSSDDPGALRAETAALEQQLADLKTELAEVRQNEARLQVILSSTTDWAWEVNDQLQYTYISPNIITILGYEAQELLGKTPLDLMPAAEAERVQALLGPVAAAHQPISLLENINLHRNGTPLIMETSGVPFFDESGAFVGYRGVDRDITQRKAMEAEIEASQQQIIAVQQAALRELSTPLIPITDNTMVMPLIGTIDSARAQQVLETMLEGVAQHQANLVILDITGVQMVDTQVANALIRAAQAVKLLGAQVVLTGIRPDVAQTLVHLGTDLAGLITHSTLQAGIAYALQRRSSHSA